MRDTAFPGEGVLHRHHHAPEKKIESTQSDPKAIGHSCLQLLCSFSVFWAICSVLMSKCVEPPSQSSTYATRIKQAQPGRSSGHTGSPAQEFAPPKCVSRFSSWGGATRHQPRKVAFAENLSKPLEKASSHKPPAPGSSGILLPQVIGEHLRLSPFALCRAHFRPWHESSLAAPAAACLGLLDDVLLCPVLCKTLAPLEPWQGLWKRLNHGNIGFHGVLHPETAKLCTMQSTH